MEQDQNLLFGVMAVQLKFLTPQQLMEAAAAWSMNRERSIREILVEGGELTEQVALMIDSLLDAQIAMHGGDVGATLHSFGGDQAVNASFAASSVLIKGDDKKPAGGGGGGVGGGAGGEECAEEDKTLCGGLDSFGGDTCPEHVTQDEDSKVFSSSASGVTSLENADSLTFEHPGRYTLKGEHSRGGIGRILIAFDGHVGREIAVKELLPDPSLGTPSTDTGSRKTTAAVNRFLREARITGQLEHPAVVPVYEVGKRHDGTIYYTMKFVRGKTLAKAIKDAKSAEDRRELLTHFLALCNALRYSHSRNVIHRDIKPQNVMVGEFGETVVLDWGLAKVKGKRDSRARSIERDLALIREAGGMETIKGTPLGTPAYMSPEQAEGRLDQVDERSDIWSVGAVLYEILTGKVPFEGINAFEIMGKVLKDEPEPPHHVEPDASEELSAIAMKCLTKDPEKRYQKMSELAKDVERYLTGGLVSAYDYSKLALFRRWLKKWWPVALTATVGAAILLVVFTWSYVNILQEKNRVLQKQREALKNISEAYLANGNWAAAEGRWSTAEIFFARSLLMDQQRTQTRYSLNYAHSMPRTTLRLKILFRGHEGGVNGTAIDPAGRFLASAGSDGTARIWDLETGKGREVIRRHKGPVNVVAFGPEGEVLATGGDDSRVCLWDSRSGDELACLEGSGKAIKVLEFSRDGKLLAAAGDDSEAFVIDVAKRSMAHVLAGHAQKIWDLEFNPAGDRLLTCSRDWQARVWDLETGQTLQILSGHKNSVSKGLFVPGGKILTTSWDKTVKVWSEATGGMLASVDVPGAPVFALNLEGGNALLGLEEGVIMAIDADGCEGDQCPVLNRWRNAHSGQMASLALLPDRKTFATCGGEGLLKVWDFGNRRPANTLEAGEGMSYLDITAGPRGKLLATSGAENVIRVWSMEKDGGVERFTPFTSGPQAGVTTIAKDREERYVAMAGDSGEVAIFDMEEKGFRGVIKAHEGTARDIAMSDDGRDLATAGADGWVKIFDLKGLGDHDGLEPLGAYTAHGGQVHSLDITPDGKYVVSAGQDGFIRVWDVQRKTLEHAIEGLVDNVNRVVEIGPGGKLAAVGLRDARVLLVDIASGKVVHELKGHSIGVRPVTFSPDGKLLASGGKDGKIVIWEVETGEMLHELVGHNHWLRMLQFSPDGGYLFAGSIIDKAVTVWDASSWRMRCKSVLTDRPQSASIRDDGALVAIGTRDGKLWLWDPWPSNCEDAGGDCEPDPNSCEFMLVMDAHEASVGRIDYAGGGANESLVSADANGTVMLWPFPAPMLDSPPEELYRRTEADTGLTIRGMDLVPWLPGARLEQDVESGSGSGAK